MVGKNNSGKTTVFEALDKLVNGNSDSNSKPKFTFGDFNYEYIKKLVEEYGNDKYDVLPSIEFVLTIGLDKGKEDLIVNLGYFIPTVYDADDNIIKGNWISHYKDMNEFVKFLNSCKFINARL